MSSSGHDDDSPERPARNPVGAGTTTTARRVKKKRVRIFTEDDRAAHRIFEKSRREAFKEALTNLASLLPALADTEPQRLSKHVVVDESIAFIRSQHEQIRTATEHLETVRTERDELLAELNHWRSRAGIQPRQANTINQPPIHHGDTSVTPEAILGAVPTALQHTDSPMPIIGEAASSFITNPLHEPNPARAANRFQRGSSTAQLVPDPSVTNYITIQHGPGAARARLPAIRVAPVV
ncbi:hypothetical protein O1611_g2142 [Lasiodiplodia mahajangana]|uniref:Uncharacterized protein n=1 Tax=Lasiodiplodia mahajangana TaxID=1108764 RepID=A0ACC2JVD0_9PEZI|nr:hypothetical protein O1611_g2142 [Lasiodiplodia mahajangana]